MMPWISFWMKKSDDDVIATVSELTMSHIIWDIINESSENQNWDMSDQWALESVSPNEGILDSLRKTDESF